MLFDNVNWNPGNDFQIPGNTIVEYSSSSKFLTPEEGFLRGNLLKEEYDPYKNMTYFKLNPESEQEKLLFKLMAYCFAINDLNLYLDLHPKDEEAFYLLKQTIKKEMELEQLYTDSYGPITISETQQETFNWLDNPWPWDKMGESNYV